MQARTIGILALALIAVSVGIRMNDARAGMAVSRAGVAGVAAFAIPPKAPSRDIPASTQALPSAREVVETAEPGLAPGVIQDALAARRLIRSGDIGVEIPSYEQGARRVEEIATSLGGFVADVRATNAAAERASGTMTLRVPSERFSDAFRRLSALGKVRNREIRTADVTKEYLDLETRLRVKRDAESRMREVLRNRPAKLSDIVEAERELTRIVEEIETMEAQRLLYDRQIALADIHLNLFEPEAPKPAVEAPSILAPIGQALRESGVRLAESVAGLITAIAVALPWVAIAALLVFVIRRLRARRPVPAVPAMPSA
jgi:hypothetical protein